VGYLDEARAAIQDDLLSDLFIPQDDDGNEVPNYRRVRYSGGSLNHLDELTGSTAVEFEFAAVTGSNARRVSEQVIGQQPIGDLTLITVADVLALGDRVERLSDGEPFEVVDVRAPELNGEVVAYVAILRKQVA